MLPDVPVPSEHILGSGIDFAAVDGLRAIDRASTVGGCSSLSASADAARAQRAMHWHRYLPNADGDV